MKHDFIIFENSIIEKFLSINLILIDLELLSDQEISEMLLTFENIDLFLNEKNVIVDFKNRMILENYLIFRKIPLEFKLPEKISINDKYFKQHYSQNILANSISILKGLINNILISNEDYSIKIIKALEQANIYNFKNHSKEDLLNLLYELYNQSYLTTTFLTKEDLLEYNFYYNENLDNLEIYCLKPSFFLINQILIIVAQTETLRNFSLIYEIIQGSENL